VEVLERINLDSDWITILMVTLIFVVFFLKLLDAKRLTSYALAMFKRSFLIEELEEEASFFNPFQIITSLFSILVFSLFLYHLKEAYSVESVDGFRSFAFIFLGVFTYFTSKWFLEFLLSLLFEIKQTIRFFLVSKMSYLYSVAFFLFFAIVFVEYSQLNTWFLGCFSVGLFLLRFVLILLNNKKLIFSKLFYFILYICAFEIAPLFILFKLMF